MGEVINLNRVRKSRQKATAAAEAAVNRSSFGRSKPMKDKMRKEAEQAKADLDGKKID